MYLHAIENNEVSGTFNAIADEKINNQTFINTLAKVLNKKVWLPKVPEIIIKATYREMGDLILKGVNASNEKVKKTGFSFEFPTLEQALIDIYSK